MVYIKGILVLTSAAFEHTERVTLMYIDAYMIHQYMDLSHGAVRPGEEVGQT